MLQIVLVASGKAGAITAAVIYLTCGELSIKKRNMENNNTIESADIAAQVDKTGYELCQLLASLSEEQFNKVPFANSWTAAQLAVHVTKSNNGISQGMAMKGKPALRRPAERVAELKKIFLNFEHKFKSPDFIVPAPGLYEKNATGAALKRSLDQLKEKSRNADLSEEITFAVLGEITKLELLYFVLYHTQRHIHQLRNIIQHL
jgi:hypothetical protein